MVDAGNQAAAGPPVQTRTELMLAQPGIERDGSRLLRRQYIEGQWCRWYQHQPRKMKGYREQKRSITAIPRALDVFSNDSFSHVHVGHGSGVTHYAIDNVSGGAGGESNRTPAGFPPLSPAIGAPVLTAANTGWQFAQVFNTADGTTELVAAVLPSTRLLSFSADYPVYHGDITLNTPLTQIVDNGPMPGNPTPPTVAMTTSGGCCAVAGFTFLYGHDGYIQWPAPFTFHYRDTTNLAGDSRPVPDKIVRGYELRGQTAPAAIFWSLTSVIIGTFTGSANVWDFTAITRTSAILSANGIIEHNGIYYWATVTGFNQFNGVVRDLPNDDNRQWFLDHLNWPQRIKVFAFKIPRWNEIWWCVPLQRNGLLDDLRLPESADECNWAIIYNYVENCWYDTPLPNGGRSCGLHENLYAFPLMGGINFNADANGYSVWQHETGTDEVSGPQGQTLAVRSYFVTNEFSFVEPQQLGALGMDQAVSYSLMEPDFDQVGDLEFTVISRANARSKNFSISGPYTVPADPGEGEQLVKFMHTGRLTAFMIESNTAGGDYKSGSPLLHFQPGDGRRED
jgi:hypothetical protein